MQQTYEALNSYKPKPFGAIEARVQKLSLAATASFKGQARADGMRVLFDLQRLRKLAESMAKRSSADIPPEIGQQYAGISMPDGELKVRAMMTELVFQAAAGMELDAGKIARLNVVGDLCDGLRAAARFQASLKSVPALSRWADWALTSEQLMALMSPYRQLVTEGFSAFMTDQPEGVATFLRLREHYAPLLTLVVNDARYAGVCAAMPEGLRGDLARLMTPF